MPVFAGNVNFCLTESSRLNCRVLVGPSDGKLMKKIDVLIVLRIGDLEIGWKEWGR